MEMRAGSLKYSIKCVIVGDESVGKSTFITLYINGRILSDIPTTIGAAFCTKTIEILPNKDKVKLQIWDTAGQERYRCLIPNFYRGAKVAFIMFDLNNRNSWESVDFWYNQLSQEKLGDLKYPMCILIGSKADKKHCISEKEIYKKAEQLKIKYYKISAFDDDSYERVSNIFNETASEVYSYLESNESFVQKHVNYSISNELEATNCCKLL